MLLLCLCTIAPRRHCKNNVEIERDGEDEDGEVETMKVLYIKQPVCSLLVSVTECICSLLVKMTECICNLIVSMTECICSLLVSMTVLW